MILSAIDAVNNWTPLGHFIIGNAGLCVSAVKVGDQFEEPIDVPIISQKFGSPDEAVSFKNWQIVTKTDDQVTQLWKSPE